MKVGDKFGHLTFVDDAGKKGAAKMVKMRCDCGMIKIMYYTNVSSGKSKTCGCITSTENRVAPMKARARKQSASSKNAAAENYRAGKLPKWMYT